MEKRCWVKTCCLCFGWLARNDNSKCKRNNIHMLIILLISMLEIRAFDSYTCFLDELHTNASFKTRWPKKSHHKTMFIKFIQALLFVLQSLFISRRTTTLVYQLYIKKKTKDKCAFNNSFKYKTDSYLINVLLNSCAKLICQNIREITKQLLLQETPLILKPKWQ